MSKNLITYAAITMLTATGAMAQTTTAPETSAPRVQNQGVHDQGKSLDRSAPQVSVATLGSTLVDIRSSKLVGAKVTAGTKSVGEINELLMDGSGTIRSVIVGMGGFLGIGEKNVKLKFEDITISRDSRNNLIVTTRFDEAALTAQPRWNDPDKTPSR